MWDVDSYHSHTITAYRWNIDRQHWQNHYSHGSLDIECHIMAILPSLAFKASAISVNLANHNPQNHGIDQYERTSILSLISCITTSMQQLLLMHLVKQLHWHQGITASVTYGSVSALACIRRHNSIQFPLSGVHH